MALKRRSTTHTRRTTSRPKTLTRRSRVKARDRRATTVRRKRPPDLQERMLQVFEEQADSLWSGFADQCRQFAEGFNHQLGGPELKVDADATTLRAVYPKGEAELFLTLDKAERYVQCWVNAGCGAEACCSPNQLPVGMTVRDDALHFAFGGEVVSDEYLAITLLTQLTSGHVS
jgi:hypothetical protein